MNATASQFRHPTLMMYRKSKHSASKYSSCTVAVLSYSVVNGDARLASLLGEVGGGG